MDGEWWWWVDGWIGDVRSVDRSKGGVVVDYHLNPNLSDRRHVGLECHVEMTPIDKGSERVGPDSVRCCVVVEKVVSSVWVDEWWKGMDGNGDGINQHTIFLCCPPSLFPLCPLLSAPPTNQVQSLTQILVCISGIVAREIDSGCKLLNLRCGDCNKVNGSPAERSKSGQGEMSEQQPLPCRRDKEKTPRITERRC